MDFTEIYKQSASLVCFSPGTHFILTAIQDRLVVRRADSFQITRTWLVDSASAVPLAQSKLSAKPSTSSTDAWITHAGWSCDSEFLLAACAKRGVVNVYKLRDDSWNARIDSGVEGLVKAEWAPDGRTVLCFSEWGLRVTIWSLVTGAATYIQYPVHPDRGYTFRVDGRYFLLAERHKSKDTLGVYDATQSYHLVRHYPLPTSSISSLSLSPTGNHLAVWEGPLEYRLHIITLAGEVLGTFAPEPEPGFGIRCVAWHPAGTLLAVGSWDDKIHILESVTWGPIATLELASRIPVGVSIWREPSNWLEATQGRGFLSYEQIQPPHTISITRPDRTKAAPKSGTVQLSWNRTGTLLLARFDSSPTAVHLFAFPGPQESAPIVPRLRSILLHERPVTAAQWNPLRAGSLAVCCASGSMYLWSDEWVGEPEGLEEEGKPEEVAECVGVPAKKFETRDLRWAPDGKGLILLDKDTFCCAFEVEEVLADDTEQ